MSGLLDAIEWALFLGVGPCLWIGGLKLFLHSGLARVRKILWAGLLIAVGVMIGLYLPLRVIRNKFLIVLLILPVLAFVDTKLARSGRGLLFWYRACAFEVCTVFGTAALLRFGLQVLKTF